LNRRCTKNQYHPYKTIASEKKIAITRVYAEIQTVEKLHLSLIKNSHAVNKNLFLVILEFKYNLVAIL
jgi:hypothetical protein